MNTHVRRVAAFLVCLVMVVAVGLSGCGGGTLVPDYGDNNNDNNGNGGNGGLADGAVVGVVVNATGVAVASATCQLVAASDLTTPLATTTTNAAGEFSFASVAAGQDVQVIAQAVVSGRSLRGSSGTFRLTAAEPSLNLGNITLNQELPPSPPDL